MAKKLSYGIWLVSVFLAASFAHGQKIDATFTYQGQLEENGTPANGTYSMEFILWDAPSGGNLLGSEAGNIEVTNGRFTRDLDFGTGAFDGNMRWLELEVENTILSPRQQITATPYATYSSNTRGINVNNDGSFVGVGREQPIDGTEAFGILAEAGFNERGGMIVETTSDFGWPYYGYQQGDRLTRHYVNGISGEWRVESNHDGGGFDNLLSVNPNGNFSTAIDETGTPHIWLSNDQLFLHSLGSFNHTLNIDVDGYIGIRREDPIVDNSAGQSWFDIQTPAGDNEFGGMHVATDAAGGIPYYGYSAGGTDSDCFHFYNGGVNVWGLRMGPGGDKLTVRGDTGRVGISQPNPQFLLHVNGSAGKPGGGSWTNASDRRLKKNIAGLENSLDKLLNLRGVTFEYKDPKAINELEGQRIGVIAQEVEKVFPDWVDERADGYKAVTYRGFEAVVVEAIRELRSEKDAQIVALEDENDSLRKRLDALEAAVGSMINNQE